MAATNSVNCKLLLIGNTSVGKTSLLIQFFDRRWVPEASATVGVDFRVHNMEVNGRRVRLSIWDTAGQEQFRSVASSLPRGTGCYSGETFEGLSRWHSELETYASEFVVKIVVGNKVDKESSRQVLTSEGEALAHRMNSLFIETSAKTAVGVSETFRELVGRILDTPELWTPGASDGSTPENIGLDSDERQSQGGCAC